MTTLKQAAQQALEAMEYSGMDVGKFNRINAACKALRDALAEPVQEPVAWRFKAMIGMPWSLSDDGYYISCKRDQRYFVEALYTAPPQRKPLTYDEIDALALDEDGLPNSHIEIAQAIERAHGIT